MTKKIINFKSIAVALALFSLFAGPLASLASGAQFNTDPLDKPTLRVSNYTQNPGSTNWSSSISNVHVGDIVSFVFYYHNAGDQTANNTRAAISFNYGSGVSAAGVISADNALSAYGSASVYPAAGETITSLTFDSAEWYPNQSASPVGAQGGPTTFNLGNITPGWSSQGYLVARYKTVGQGQPPVGSNGAACLSVNAPSSVNSGQTFSATITMKNTGTKTWTTGAWPVSGYFLGSQNPQDNQIWGLGRVDLPSSPIASGQTANFSFTATAPAVSSGSNKAFAWQMVQENVEWFGQMCSKTIYVNPTQVANPTLTISPSSATVNVGSGVSFHANYDPDGTGPMSSYEVTASSAWTSSNNSVANVSGGYVTGVYQGSATITATYNNLSATAYVTVNPVYVPPSGSAPVVSTNNATGIGQSFATLNGSGTPKGAATSCWFEYGSNTGLGQTIGNQSIGSGNSAVSLSSYLSGLSANTTYYFRAACQNSYGTTRGSILSFKTSNNPPAGNPTLTVSPTSGSISAGQNFKFFALYDADGPQGSQSAIDVSYSASWISSNSSVASVASAGNITGVSNGAAVISAVYSGLTATGSINVSGTSAGNAPTVSTNSATNINQSTATLNGQVNPNGFATTYWFEYGTSYSLGQTTFTQSAGSGTGNISAVQGISGLSPNTAYYFRLTAQNQYGTSHGQILSFTTQNGGGSAATLIVSPSSATVNVGSGTSLRAYYDADGSGSGQQTDITNSASWISSNTSVANVSGGYVTGAYQGSATITATYSGLSATAYVNVIGGTQGSAPIASTNGATNIAQNYATLNGLVNPNNAATTYWFEYGTTYSLGQTAGNQSIGSGSSAQNVSYAVYGLNANTTYYFRVVAQNQYGTNQGQILSFVTNGSGGCTYNCGGSAPIVTTNYVSNLNLNSATMNGTVNPNGSNTNYWFEYGQTSSLGQTTGFQYLGNYSGPQNVSAQIYNLLSNMNYYYRVVAQNSYGTTYGSVYNFTTGNNNQGNCNYNGGGYYGNSAPCVETLTPTNLGNNYATFNARVSSNGNGGDSIVGWFEYGINSNSLTYTTNNSFIPSYATNYNFSNGVTNLTENTSYYVRAVARNSYGTSYGQTYQFSTTGNGGGTNLPAVLTKPATYVGRNSALLNGSANPNSGVGNAWFEYGPTASLGLRTNMQPVGSGNSYVDTAFALTSLLQNTTYYFRIVAQTPAGTSYGSILRFTTTGGTVVPPVNPPIEPPIVVGSSCLKLSPAIYPSSGITAGDEVVYTLTYKNDCGYDLSNAALQIVLPLEASFLASNNSFASKNSNTLSYNFGLVQAGYQGVVEIRSKIGNNVEKGDSLVYGSTMNWTDKKGKFQTTSAYITALVGAGAVAGLASLLSIFGGWGWLWLLLLLLIIFAIYWLFFRKEEKTAVQKIEQSIA